jgi:putative dimethyl sulfoxide reductase chaperone
MTTTTPFDDDPLAEFRAAVALDLDILALLHNAELDDKVIERMAEAGFPGEMGLTLESTAAREALELTRRAFSALERPLSPAASDELAADYAAIYLTYAYQASPCESVWLDQENLGMQAPMFQVRDFYRLFDRAAENWRMRSDDHICLELQFLAALLRDAHPQALPEAARFLDEHLLRWLPLFARRVAARCATPLYAGVARLTEAYCEELRDLLAELLGEPRPSPEEVEARMKPRPVAGVQPLSYMPGVAPSW